jgi:hypothetical protein
MDFLEFARLFGLPVAMLLFAIFSGAMGWWIFKGAHEAIIKGKDDRIASLLDRLKEEEERRAEVETRLLSERDRAIALAMEGWGRAEHVLDLNGVPKPSPTNSRRRRESPA